MQVIHRPTRQTRQNQPGQDEFTMMKPGSKHHARFMAPALYILKIALLGDDPADFPQGLVTDDHLAGIKQMAEFIAIFYGPWFLQARIAAVAPRLDLQLWNDMNCYEVRILYFNQKHKFYVVTRPVIFFYKYPLKFMATYAHPNNIPMT